MTLDLDRVNHILDTLSAMLRRRGIARELEALKRYAVEPEQIDDLVLAAIGASLALEDERLPGQIPTLSITAHPEAARAA